MRDIFLRSRFSSVECTALRSSTSFLATRKGTLPNLLCPAPCPLSTTAKPKNMQYIKSIFGRKPKSVQPSERQPELVIAVIGCHGSGKSQFIYDITGRKEDQNRVCHSLTQKQAGSVFEEVRINIQDPSFPVPTITLIDTPGIEIDNPRMEQKALDDLCKWLKKKKLRVDGLVYMHNISSMNPHKNEGPRSSALFTSRPGLWNHDLGNPKQVIFVNTHWEQCQDGRQLEQVLKDGYWSEMHQKGSCMRTYKSLGQASRLEALAILKQLIQGG
ncbi:hypothetical protein Agabi119p4_8457 [Agaricus bisporus var. burnettii]|uniref:G domain-containing protein n=1 Tax=Agaricus bisporus var. burnettii TaxID=192524 RepID=A0A8H7EYI7_AGABI|nr:hypothetical protein Agabi119p4_8457 [Agaricus bisporus var. burnettii]